jgi:hypothetical protein
LGHTFFVDICGSLAIIFGLVLLVKWLVGKFRPKNADDLARTQAAFAHAIPTEGKFQPPEPFAIDGDSKNGRGKVAPTKAATADERQISNQTPAVAPALQAAMDALESAAKRELHSPGRANRKATEAAQARYNALCEAMLNEWSSNSEG